MCIFYGTFRYGVEHPINEELDTVEVSAPN